MYRELLDEFENMKRAGEDMDKFASDVLSSMEKTAFLGVALKGTAAVGKTLFKPLATGGKSLFTKNLSNIKQYGATGAALSFLPAVAGQRSIADSALDFGTGGMWSTAREVGQDFKNMRMQNRMPSGMMQNVAYASYVEPDEMEKQALLEDKDEIKKMIANIAVIGGLGLGGYAGAHALGSLFDRRPELAAGISSGVEKAISSVGKGTMRTFANNRPLTAFVNATVTGAGKIADKLNINHGKLRTNFDSLTGLPDKKALLKHLGLYLGTMASVSVAEDYVTDRITNYLGSLNKDQVPSNAVDISVVSPDGDVQEFNAGNMRRSFNTRRNYGGDRREYRDRSDSGNYRSRGTRDGSFERTPFDRKPFERRPFERKPFDRSYVDRAARSKPFINDTTAEDDTIENTAFQFGTYLNSLEKEAISRDGKRLLGERVVKPMVTTGTFMLSLAALSRLIGRNLYGGFEKVRKDKDISNTGRIIIDIPNHELDKSEPARALVKKANVITDAAKMLEKTRLDRIKDKIDAKVVNGPKFIRKLDKLLADQELNKYKGKTGIAHLVAEEVPFKVVEGLSYSLPMAGVAVLTGRNLKRAFEPIQKDPNVGAPPGMTRIIIEDRGDQQKKASDDEETSKVKDRNGNGIDDELEGITDPPVRQYVTNNQKRKAEKKASVEYGQERTAQEKIEILDKAFPDELERKVAYMIATSHEYKKPNTDAAISFVKNYKWELSKARVTDLQGIDKPIIEEKVESMVKTIDKDSIAPFITVNQFHGIRPQTPGKKILVDGHHRKEACIRAEIAEVPIYKGIYTGKAEKSTKELVEGV